MLVAVGLNQLKIREQTALEAHHFKLRIEPPQEDKFFFSLILGLNQAQGYFILNRDLRNSKPNPARRWA
jgi:hypothetical protein